MGLRDYVCLGFPICQMSRLDQRSQLSSPGYPSASCSLSLTSKQLSLICNLKPATRKGCCRDFHFFEGLITKDRGKSRHHAPFHISLRLFSFITNFLVHIMFTLGSALLPGYPKSGNLPELRRPCSPPLVFADFSSDRHEAQRSLLSQGLLQRACCPRMKVQPSAF